MSEAARPSDAERLTDSRLLVRNVGLNVAGWIVPLVLAFVAIPVLVRGLGEARFGVLSLAWAFIGYFSLFDLGMGRALTQLVSQGIGRDSPEELSGLVWTALWMLLPLGVAGALVVWLTAPWMVHRVLRIPLALQGESLRAFQMLALAIPFTVHTAGLRGVLEATQSFGRVNALRVPLALATFVAPICVLPFAPNLPAALAVLAAGRAALWLAHAWSCRQVFAPLRRVAPPEPARLRPLLTVGGWMTVSNIVSPLMYAGDRFVVGAMLSISAVTYYTTAYESVTRLWVVTGVLLPVLFPALSLALTSDREHAAGLFDRAMRLTLAASVPAALAVGALAPEWLALWVGHGLAGSVAPLAQALAPAVFVNIVAQIVYTLVQAGGRADLTGKFHLAEVVPYGALLWVLIGRYGAMGVVIAWGVRASVDAALLFVAAARVLPSARPYLRHAALTTLVVTPLLVAPIGMRAVATRTAYVASLLALWLVYAWWRLVRPEERALIRQGLPRRSRTTPVAGEIV